MPKVPIQFTTDQLLVIERLKNKILKQIIFQKLGINIDDTIDGLDTTIVAEEIDMEIEPVKRESVRKAIDKKKFKQFPKSSEEVDIVANDNMGDGIKKMMVETFGVFNYEDVKSEIEQLFQELVTSRSYTNILASIKNKRTFHLACMNLKEYTTQLKNDIARIRTIFTQKEFESKKINTIVSRILTPIDYRLMFHDGFEKLYIEPEYIDKLRMTLYNCVNYPTSLTCFDDTHFITYFMTYNSIFFGLEVMIKTYIDNPYKFKNIIYIESPSDDPLGFAYYLLNKIDQPIKYWTLDRRLEALTRDLSQNLKQYLVQMFRKIYKLCYGHNKFVEMFRTKYPILEVDIVLLLNNLFLAVNEPRLNKMIRHIIKSSSLHIATTNDKFDKIADDRGQCVEFKEMALQDSDKIQLVTSLFDDMDEKRALAFYSEFL